MKIWLSVLFAIFCSALVFPAEAAPRQVALPANAQWSVAFSTLEGKSLSPENDHLVKNIPYLIKGELESIGKHYFDDASKQAYRRALVFEKLKEQYALLAQNRKARDEFVFDDARPEETEKKIRDIDAAGAKIAAEISRLSEYDVSSIGYPETLPIQVMTTKKDDILFDAPRYSPLQFALDNKINLLVYGSVEEIQGYIVVEIKALDSVKEADVYAFRMVLSPDELSSAVDKAKEGVAGAILGIQWGTVTFTIDPAKSILYMNDEFIGIGNTRLQYVPVGKKKITAEAPGYLPVNEQVEISAGKDTALDIKLVKRELAKVRVTSDPAGANVYVNSEWAGKTPLDIEKTSSMKRVLLTMEGYDDYSFHVDVSSGEAFDATLTRHEIDFNARQAEARDNFYASFGFFLVSIALPIFINGYANDYALVITESGSSGPPFDAYRVNYNVLSGAYWGAITVTAVLGVTTVVYLIQYIIASDRPFG